MKKYLRLYAYFLRFSFSKSMEFRFDFFFRILMDFAWYGTQIAFFSILYKHTNLLGGWNFDQVLIFMGSIFVVDAVNMTVFSNNFWWLPTYVNRGELDYYLMRPVSSLFFLSLRDFAANSFMNLFFAIGFLVWTILRYPESFSIDKIMLFIFLLICGILLFAMMGMIFIIPVFWLHSQKGLKDIFSSFQRFGNQPHRIYSGWIKHVLTSILPFAFVASYPVSILFENSPLKAVMHSFILVISLFLFMRYFWKKGLRAYSSASS